MEPPSLPFLDFRSSKKGHRKLDFVIWVEGTPASHFRSEMASLPDKNLQRPLHWKLIPCPAPRLPEATLSAAVFRGDSPPSHLANASVSSGPRSQGNTRNTERGGVRDQRPVTTSGQGACGPAGKLQFCFLKPTDLQRGSCVSAPWGSVCLAELDP